MYELGRIERAEYDQKCREIEEQRARMAAPPMPLFGQQRQVLTTLVQEWDALSADEKKRTLAAVFDSITASAEGVNRLEPCESWRPYVIAAIPQPVQMREGPTERKTGVKHADVITTRVVQDARGWLRLAD
jgi:hypothetical protein